MIDISILAFATVVGVPLGLYINKLMDKDYKIKQQIKRNLLEIFKEKKITNSKEEYPKILNIKLFNYGFAVTVDIKKICTYKDIEKLEGTLLSTYAAVEVKIINKYSVIEAEIINKPVQELCYVKTNLKDTQLLLGHDFKGNPITVDMLKTPHLLVTGLSGQGKTYMIKTIIKNLDTPVILLNAFTSDFKDMPNITSINDLEKIRSALETIVEGYRTYGKPLYVVIEEISSIRDKKILELIKKLLCYGRHYNVYVISVIQIATKEEFNAKCYFNARVTFRQIENSSYNVAVGISVDKHLQKREFILVSDNVYRGRTYTIS